MIEAKALEKASRKVVAIISDGCLRAGLTFEGLNQAGHLNRDLIVILNDNSIFTDPRIGAFSSFLSKQLTTELAINLQKNLTYLLRTGPGVGEDPHQITRKVMGPTYRIMRPRI